jgi:hypothetical protein
MLKKNMSVLLKNTLLLLLAAAVIFFRELESHDSLNDFLETLFYTCKIEPWGVYRPGPYKSSILCCLDYDNAFELFGLINHMRLNSYSMDASFAAEFGSHVKLVYKVSNNLIMINPKIILDSNVDVKMISCKDMVGNEIQEVMRLSQIKVSFIGENFKTQNETFVNSDACLIQTIFDSM